MIRAFERNSKKYRRHRASFTELQVCATIHLEVVDGFVFSIREAWNRIWKILINPRMSSSITVNNLDKIPMFYFQGRTKLITEWIYAFRVTRLVSFRF